MTEGTPEFSGFAGAAADEASAAEQRVGVALPLPLGKIYDYLAPHGLRLRRGAFVLVPFGPNRLAGIVWGEGGDLPVGSAKLKRIEHVFETPPLAPEVLDFLSWTATYTATPLGPVLRLLMRSGDALAPPSGAGLCALGTQTVRSTPQREAVLAVLRDGPRPTSELAERAGVGAGVVRGLIAAGAVVETIQDPDPPFDLPDLRRAGRVLSPAQADSVAKIAGLLGQGATSPRPILLDGVTGSGKTEVYLEAAAAALERDADAQVLI
ncbi:MAG: primosomal protein N', partial [Parvularculaceae bacterium]|nr:primosomal protein N' [Parvularculaceae bacterium]